MTDGAEIWYSFSGEAFNGQEPAYYDAKDFAWIASATEIALKAKSESAEFLSRFADISHPYFVKELVSKKDGWKQGTFYFWGKRNAALCKAAPKYDELFMAIPGMLSAGISLLEGNTTVLPHYGDTNAVIRCHFGISVPAGLPECGIKVSGESRAWSENEWILFCDAHKHEAWNKTNSRRIVLIVDVLSPAYLHKRKEICCNVSSMHSLQQCEAKFPFVRKLPGTFRGIIRRSFLILHYLRYKNEY